jgi:hypothetical protein
MDPDGLTATPEEAKKPKDGFFPKAEKSTAVRSMSTFIWKAGSSLSMRATSSSDSLRTSTVESPRYACEAMTASGTRSLTA